MRNPLGYKVLRTYQQGEEIYQLTKKFTANYLHIVKDSRLISHMNDSGRSVPRNTCPPSLRSGVSRRVAEGYGRNNTKQYYEFLGFSFGSLLELLEDLLELEREINEGLRITKDNKGALWEISKTIKLCMGEKTMLKNQMDRIQQMVGEQGLISHNQRLAKIIAENHRREREFDQWLEEVRKTKNFHF